MSKRGATSELNHDNWNDELEAEDAGTFKVAARAELETRKILRPRRKLQETNAPSNPFASANFSGFATPPIVEPAPPATIPTVEPVIPSTTEAELNPDESAEESSSKIENGKFDLDQPKPEPNNEDKSSRDESNPPIQNDQSNNSDGLGELEGQNDNSVEDKRNSESEKENPDELDLPDFVDQSDEEDGMDPKSKDDKSDSEEDPESE